MTDVYEGSLIRMFRRLEELLRQMAMAAKVMGSAELEQKFELCLTKIKRGNRDYRFCSWLCAFTDFEKQTSSRHNPFIFSLGGSYTLEACRVYFTLFFKRH